MRRKRQKARRALKRLKLWMETNGFGTGEEIGLSEDVAEIEEALREE